ncbi:jg4325 [Pararge aegeria aegeria]|uniref:Jg4325 protein n=1 Tax=Pararge aegeria aegeria TaxID=348720 RepID=A0A8S4SNA6_9NEOP|nr:jg4325 [Pararge aegeria aegeria]
MYVIYPADEVVSLTYSSHSLPRPRQRPTLDIIIGPPPPSPRSANLPTPTPAPPRATSVPKTAPPEPAERAPASPSPSLERPAKQRERTKATKLFKKLGRHEDTEFGKIVRTPAPDEFELPAPLPTPAFSRKNIFDRDFDALFEIFVVNQHVALSGAKCRDNETQKSAIAEHILQGGTQHWIELHHT